MSSVSPPVSPGLLPVLEQLQSLEPLIYAANDGRPRSWFENLLVEDFWEVGGSGQIYDRETVLSVLEQRCLNPREEAWSVSATGLRQIDEQHYLYTYSLQQPTRLSRRASLWRRCNDGWKLVYHQGTPVA